MFCFDEDLTKNGFCKYIYLKKAIKLFCESESRNYGAKIVYIDYDKNIIKKYSYVK